MASLEVHQKKYQLFRNDALSTGTSEPTRIGACFEACFHLIEACAALQRLHINKHQLVREVLEQSPAVIGEGTEVVWQAFQELENQIRPGQLYGGAINGERLQRALELLARIEAVCLPILRKAEKK